ncbi:PAS domain-containing sensor histidine kinase [Desulfocurvus sp. DL9XJH121]
MDDSNLQGPDTSLTEDQAGGRAVGASPRPVDGGCARRWGDLDILPDPVLIFRLAPDPLRSSLVFANRACVDLIGHEPGAAVRLRLEDVLRAPLGGPFFAALGELGVLGGFTLETTLRRKDGGEVPVEAGVRLSRRDGRDACVCVCRVLGPGRRVEQALGLALENYRRLFDGAVEGGFQSTLSGRFIRANPAMARMLGYDSPKDLILSVQDFNKELYASPEERREFLDLLRREGQARRYFTRFRRRDGGFIWVGVNARLVRGATDVESHIEGFCTDVTDLKETREALRSSEELHRVLLMNLTDTAWITDDQGRFAYVCPNARPVLGLSPEEVMALPDVDALLGEGFIDPGELDRTGEIANLEARVSVGGDVRFLLVTVRRVDIAGGTRLYACRDITEMRSLQAESMRAAHLASLGELAAGVAHEINSPVNGIMLYAEMLQDEAVDLGEAAEAPASILRQAGRVAAIARKLLGFSRKPGDAVRPVDVRAILNDALALARVDLLKGNIRLRLHQPVGLPLVAGRDQEVQQVFVNLLSNARDALNEKYPGRDENKILAISLAETERDGTRFVRAEFLDHGVGVPEALRQKIFTPFFSTKADGQGTGLGLPTSMRLLADLGGQLALDSREGGPTRVVVEFKVWEAEDEN